MASPEIEDRFRASEHASELAELLPDPSLTAAARASHLPYDQTIDLFLTGYAARPALGERAYRREVEPATGDTFRDYQTAFQTISYRELQERVRALSLAWRHESKCSVACGDLVGIIGFASIDYAVIDLALAYAKAIPVPLSSHHSAAELREILLPIRPVALAVSVEHLPSSVDLATQVPGLRSLVVFDHDPAITRERSIVEETRRKILASGGDLELVALQDLVDRGKSHPFDFLPSPNRDNEDTALLIHTSGSTGKPKGACISAKALINTWKNISNPQPKVTVVLAPFHHMMGRDSMYSTLNVGGTAYFTLKADMSTLFEDIRLSRPTVLTLFPRICEMIHQYFQDAMLENPVTESPKSRSSFLGDRLESVTVASAPILPKIKDFIAHTFQVPVHEGYSSTETASGGLAMNGRLNRDNVTDYKLRDVPESGYYSTDKPHPRGELCVKTRFGIREYFGNPEASANLLDEDGFCRTGDIVEELGPNRIAIIDRLKDVIKLSQGEFVAVGKLGKLFEQGSSLIHQFYVHGDARRSYLLAIAVPDFDANRPPPSREELRSLLRSEIHRIGRENGLRNFEIPRDFIIAEEPFTQENGLLSSVNKYLRPAIKNRYHRALEELYESHERLRRNELEAFNVEKSSLGIEDKLRGLLNTTLGVRCGRDERSKSFHELGGDSLAAVLLSFHIEKEFGIRLQGDQILSPRGNIREWARLIENAPKGHRQPATFETIHGRNPDEIHARDLRLNRFVAEETLIAASTLPRSLEPPVTVLLTGASGFLGGRICLKWLEKLAALNGKLVCLVRPSTTRSAKERLDKRLARHDSATTDRYRQLSERHLQVVSGDVSEPFLGLDPSTYDRLAREVDAVCHCAALVNHLLAYEHLFRPNVIGTAEVIRFATTHKRKSIDFVSSIGVRSLSERSEGPPESAPLLSSVPLTESYAIGYFLSKWAGEHLLRSAHLQTGIPVNVIRPGLIMPDRYLAGEMNKDDILSRLIYSMVVTGMAPDSFDEQDPTTHEAGFRIDGLPVDLLSEVIVGLSDFPSRDLRVSNACNDSDAAISLDSLVGWIESAGYQLQRIRDYRDWSDRMETALRALPREQRSHSILNVMEAYRAKTPAELGSAQCNHRLASRVPGGSSVPFFSEGYIHKYLRDLASLGLLPDQAVVV
jgi:fatty acid CoA ligase FadD9